MGMQGTSQCVCVCVCVWLFERHLFVYGGTDEDFFFSKREYVSPLHTHANLHPQGSPWAVQIGSGWLKSRFRELIIRRCISLKAGTQLTLMTAAPNMLLFSSNSTATTPLFLLIPLLPALLIYQFFISFSFTCSFHFPFSRRRGVVSLLMNDA